MIMVVASINKNKLRAALNSSSSSSERSGTVHLFVSADTGGVHKQCIGDRGVHCTDNNNINGLAWEWCDLSGGRHSIMLAAEGRRDEN